jgi:hypothetical protein
VHEPAHGAEATGTDHQQVERGAIERQLHREVDRRRDVGDRLVGGQRLNHVGVLVDGVQDAAELGAQRVAEELPAHRAVPPRRPDHRDRAWLEHAAHRGHRGGPLTFLEAGHRIGGDRGGELDLDRVRRRAHLDREPLSRNTSIIR